MCAFRQIHAPTNTTTTTHTHLQTYQVHTQSWLHEKCTNPVQIRMYKRYVVITGDNIAKGRQPLLHTYDTRWVWQSITYVLQLLVCRGTGHQEAVFVAWTWHNLWNNANIQGQQGPNAYKRAPEKHVCCLKLLKVTQSIVNMLWQWSLNSWSETARHQNSLYCTWKWWS